MADKEEDLPKESKSISISPLSDKVERTGGDANISAADSDVSADVDDSSLINILEEITPCLLLADVCINELLTELLSASTMKEAVVYNIFPNRKSLGRTATTQGETMKLSEIEALIRYNDWQ